MKLGRIIASIEPVRIQGDTDREISGVTFDSREAGKDSLFVAVRGTATDGHRYIAQAVKAGAVCVVCEEMPADQTDEVTWIEVSDTRKALGMIADTWYGHPSRELKLTGVTGTNGKTTIATLLYKVHTGLGYKAGLLSTIEVNIGGEIVPAAHTTPNPLKINAYLRQMVNAGCEFCFMEVSSHATSQHRIAGLHFTGAVFTNLTHDHLDYHGDFRAYLEAKKRFFDQLEPGAFALVNADDKHAGVMLEHCKAKAYRYGLHSVADFRGKILEPLFEGSRMEINGQETWIRLPGKFNAGNMMAIYGVSVLLGHEIAQVLQVISTLAPVPGRFETLKGDSGATGVVDFAHTDDALENVLTTIRDVNRGAGEVIVVVGAGGDRDKAKRPKMARVAVNLAQKVILTSDNPRSEKPEDIMADMEKGIPPGEVVRVMKISDREEAIKTACIMARSADIVVVAGKGHEKTQEIDGVKYPFDDKEVIRKYLK